MKIYLIKKNSNRNRGNLKKKSIIQNDWAELTIGPLISVLEESLVDRVCNKGVANRKLYC